MTRSRVGMMNDASLNLRSVSRLKEYRCGQVFHLVL